MKVPQNFKNFRNLSATDKAKITIYTILAPFKDNSHLDITRFSSQWDSSLQQNLKLKKH